MTIIEQLMLILNDAEQEIVEVLESLMEQRLCLRLGVESLPEVFTAVLVDATCKAYRRLYFEGIKSENIGGLSVSFADDILSEYEAEITNYKRTTSGVVRFL